MGFFDKLFDGLKKTRNQMDEIGSGVFAAGKNTDDEFYELLEDMLIFADVGAKTSAEICGKLRLTLKKEKIRDCAEARPFLINIVKEMLAGEVALKLDTQPSIILVIGVNGVGKTTSIGKIAAKLKAEGKRVILGAADTFRAAAIDQLEIWAQRAGAEIIKQAEGADPAAVVFDTISAGQARGADVIMIDTAGRLHNKKNLMDELAKIHRVIDKEASGAAREVLLVLDATTGQNAVNQAAEFNKITDITGIILSKLDGTAKGGIVISIKNDLGIPVKFIGLGEGIDDLQAFDSESFAEALFAKDKED